MLYVCCSYGQHLATRDVVTGSMTYQFSYDVNSYSAKLVRVSDLSAGRSVVVRRDYRLHAQSLTTIATPGARRPFDQSRRPLRCHVTTDVDGLLASLTGRRSSVRWSYVRDSGLLRSRAAPGLHHAARTYRYSADGRLTAVTYSTGRQCRLTSRLDADTDAVHVDNSCDRSHVRLRWHATRLDIHCSKTTHTVHCTALQQLHCMHCWTVDSSLSDSLTDALMPQPTTTWSFNDDTCTVFILLTLTLRVIPFPSPSAPAPKKCLELGTHVCRKL